MNTKQIPTVLRQGVKTLLTVVAAAAGAIGLNSCEEYDEQPLSLWMAHSEMVRVPNATHLDFRNGPKWDYSSSLELLAMLKAAERYDDAELRNYVMQWADTMIAPNGDIRGYDPEKYNIDHVCPGKLLLMLSNLTGEQRFMTAAGHLMKQMETHPRTEEGGFWHKKVYPHQMWLDGLYMGAPFIAQYGQLNNVDVAEDMVRQFLIVGRHTYDDSTHLYRHAWDESHQMFWADSITGCSQHAWGRANGWYMMAMTDILEFIPEQTAGRDSLLNILNGLAKSLLDYRDPKTGMWFQVLDSPKREGNYVESSCSSMFIYSMLKGARLGYLPAEFSEIGSECFKQFVNTFVKEDETGMTVGGKPAIRVTQCCAVAGLGGKDMRDGTFDYYIKEPIRDNDAKTVGPFILACLEMNM